MRQPTGCASAVENRELAGMDLHVLHSCHSSWYFDSQRHRFQRVPRGVEVSPQAEWADYHRLELSPTGCFVVSLNDDDTRLLRSWIHAEPCPHCESEERTQELRLQPAGRA